MSEANYAFFHKNNGLLDKLALKKRLQMFQLYMTEFPIDTYDYVLDVGITSDKNALSSNFFEANFPQKYKIIALSNQDASYIEALYPGLKFKLGDAKALPFKDESIDIVFSAAVIEHVGSIENQEKMLAECYRVAKKGIFITTPNRWHPIDVHTVLPFIHWLPKSIHRMILKILGIKFLSYEENLNLLDRKTIERMCKNINIKNYKIKKIKTGGFTSNLILIIQK
ncbi:MAG: class I SAM-dependent methyltransferase [Gammaproteobacteria bacterium]